MNRAALKTQAADFAGDQNQTRYTSTQYNTAADRAQEQFALDTRALWKDTSWSHSANDSNESLPSDFMFEEWVTYDGKELTPISKHELNKLKGTDWTTETSALPTRYIIDPEEAVKDITLYPIPTDAKTLALRYFPLPTGMSADTDTPLNSSALLAQFHIGLAAYMAWLLLNGEQPTSQIQIKMANMLRIYNDAVTKAIDTFKNTVTEGLSFKGTRRYA